MIRFGVSGTGGFVERAVLPMLQKVENARVTALCGGRNFDKVQRLCETFHVPRRCRSFEELIRGDDVDAVYVCSPNVYHKDQTVAAARAGKHVFCEKPMALNAKQCRRMVDACRAQGVKLGVGFCYPFAGGQQKAKELIRQGAVGEVSYAHISYNLGGYNKETVGWRCDPKLSGGGPLQDLAPHLINLACFFLDDTVESVMAYVQPDLTETDIELDAVAVLQFSKGARASIENSFVRSNVHNYTVVGTAGQLHACNTMCWHVGGELTLEKGRERQNVPFDLIEGIEEEFRRFCTAIERNEEPPMPGEAGLHAQAVIDAIYQSGRTGRRCKVKY